MARYYKTSQSRLDTCHEDINRLFTEVVKEFDNSIIEGARGAVIQMGYFHSNPKKTKLVYPLSEHNPDIDIPTVARILECEPDIESIKTNIVVATPRQLVQIDEITPLGKSKAIDCIPWPVDWRFENDILKTVIPPKPAVSHYKVVDMEVVHNIERWAMFIGVVKGIASQMGIKIRCGADWDGDNNMSDQKFDDWAHFELAS